MMTSNRCTCFPGGPQLYAVDNQAAAYPSITIQC